MTRLFFFVEEGNRLAILADSGVGLRSQYVAYSFPYPPSSPSKLASLFMKLEDSMRAQTLPLNQKCTL